MKPTTNDTGQTPAPAATKIHDELQALKDSILRIAVNFRELRSPLDQSRAAVPQATSQLDKVTQQTEQAAARVLDHAEKLSSQLAEMVTLLNVAINDYADRKLEGPGRAALEKAEELANISQNDAFTIIDALQFQDITSQQINSAASMLEEVEERLDVMLGFVDRGSGAQSAPAQREKSARKERAFDPHADMQVKHTGQSGVDDLVRATIKKS